MNNLVNFTLIVFNRSFYETNQSFSWAVKVNTLVFLYFFTFDDLVFKNQPYIHICIYVYTHARIYCLIIDIEFVGNFISRSTKNEKKKTSTFLIQWKLLRDTPCLYVHTIMRSNFVPFFLHFKFVWFFKIRKQREIYIRFFFLLFGLSIESKKKQKNRNKKSSRRGKKRNRFKKKCRITTKDKKSNKKC